MHSSSTTAARRGLVLVLAAATLWGTGGLVATLAYNRTDLTAIDVATWRLAVAALAALPLLLRFGQRSSSRRVRVLGVRPWGAAAVGAGLAWYQVSYFAAVEQAGVSLSTFIALGAAPVLVAVAEAALHHRRPDAVVLAAMAVALTGLVLLVGGPVDLAPARHGNVLLGALLALGSATGYAVVTVVSGRVRGDDDPRAFAARTFWVGALALLPVALVGAGGLDVPTDALAGGALVYLGVGPTAGAYAMFFAGLGSVRASAASIATLVEPLTAALLAAALLGERLSARGIAGAALLVGAVVLLLVRPAQPDDAAATTGDPAAPPEPVPLTHR